METNNDQNSGNAPEKGSYERSAQFGTSNDDSQTYTGSEQDRAAGNSRESNDERRLTEEDQDSGIDSGRDERNASQIEGQQEDRRAGERAQDSTDADRNSGLGRKNEADWSE